MNDCLVCLPHCNDEALQKFEKKLFTEREENSSFEEMTPTKMGYMTTQEVYSFSTKNTL